MGVFSSIIERGEKMKGKIHYPMNKDFRKVSS